MRNPQKIKYANPSRASDAALDDEFQSLTSLEQIGIDTFVNYQGVRQPDGAIAATRLEFEPSEIERG